MHGNRIEDASKALMNGKILSIKCSRSCHEGVKIPTLI